MVFTQVLTGNFVFLLNSRFRSLIFTLNDLYLVIFLGFNGCLLLDPLRFISYHLLIIRR